MSLVCELITWKTVQRLARSLAFKLVDASFTPDIIVAIGRGGCVPARIVADYLQVFQVTSIKIEHYTMGAQRQRHARIRYPLAVDVSGMNVLIVDDVNDSGDTLILAKEHIDSHEPREIRTAVLHHKIVSHFQPDFAARGIVKWRWLIYPWAVIEDLTGFIMQMENQPLSPVDIAQRLERDYHITVSQEMLHDVLALMSWHQNHSLDQ